MKPIEDSSPQFETESRQPRFVVGIDLGTTNSALCFVDTAEAAWRIETFLVPQLVSAGEVERRETLPSFRYEAVSEERASGATRVPWQADTPDAATGLFARDHGRLIPGRLIESAKSWLCHSGVDRRAALLPWHGAADIQRLSPVEASASYLRHLRDTWNHLHPDEPLEKQDVVLTIPASFDEVARELTVAAARLAGLPRIVLLEEPQAAFYSWVYFHRDSWEQIVRPGQKILVCDIGGGTSDFSLIRVESDVDGRLQFHRVAVGDHLLLGGDNLDLALAHDVEHRLTGGGRLEARQWSLLLPACRHAKELLLGEQAPEAFMLVLAGGGSRLIGSSLQTELQRADVVSTAVQGFLPFVDLDAQPVRRQSGFQEFGLPYAADPAITKYLAAFLRAHAQQQTPSDASPQEACRQARPDLVLFNGGFFASPVLRSRLIEALEKMFQPCSPGWSPEILTSSRLDLAVAQGAAYFGMVRRGVGVRIVAGLARTYYIGVEQPDGTLAALCLVPAGTQASAEPIAIDRAFRLRTSEPVEFPVFVSGTRLTDRPGQLIPFNPEQMTPLPPIRTVLSMRRRQESSEIQAGISVRLTEIGTLELWCHQISGPGKWQLQFDVRSATETDRQAHTGSAERSGIVDQDVVTAAVAVLQSVFSQSGQVNPDETMKRLGEAIGMSKDSWPPSLLRALWAELILLADGRRRSPKHEARWLNLTGFCLRPGFGMAADDWRVQETWRVTGGRLIHSVPACLTELRTLCRRISGGLAAGLQNQIASTVLPAIRQRYRQVQTGRGKAAPYASGNHEASEIWRMLGSLELLDVSIRTELGSMILDFLNRAAFEPVRDALIWTLGRVGCRVPVYGPLNLVVPAATVQDWLEQLLRTGDFSSPAFQFAVMQMSRRTGDRFRDSDESLRRKILDKLTAFSVPSHLMALIRDGGNLKTEEVSVILGEALPAGLRIIQVD